ncbi:MAG: glycosyltransferase family 4 protein [Crocinitomicaceae bacterium]|nr:glycosyltransferase family 4 protein [Crocinitomicaceae bacterium]
MIKVLRIVNRFNLGGPVYNVTYLTAFMPDEFETVLCGAMPENHEGNALFIPENYGVKPVIIDSMQRSINPFSDRKALKEIRKIIQEYKPDIVHTHASKAGVLGRTAAIKEKVPVIVHTFHGHVFHSYFGKIKTWIYKTIERRLAKKTDAIIAISDIQKKELSEIHHIANAGKITVIPLGFDLDRFRENKEQKRKSFREKYNLEEDEVAVGIIGRLTVVKNHELFFHSIEKLIEQNNSKVRAFIIGDGERTDELKSLAKVIEDKSGKSVFEFTSWIKNVDEALPGLDIIALSSFNEGTPVSLIEAQAAGVPVITTNVGGVSDVVANGSTGFIINGFGVSDFASKLSLLAEDRELRQKMSQNGWNFVEHKFHYRRLCADMTKLYHQLLDKKKIK